MKNHIAHYFSFLALICIPILSTAQITNLVDAQGVEEGTYTFNFGDGDFQGYVDSAGWVLWLQYHHAGGTNPTLNLINPGNDLPLYDSSLLGTDLSEDLTKWGHGSQAFAASITDDELWLRWEAVTSNHNRKIHFESPVLGKFQSDSDESFGADITTKNILRADHTANLPASSGGSAGSNAGNKTLTQGPFLSFNKQDWNVRNGGRWNVDDVRNDDVDETLIYSEHSTIHRVWVKSVPFNSDVLDSAFSDLRDHINGVETLTSDEIIQIKNTIYNYSKNIGDSEALIANAQAVVDDYDAEIGALFTNFISVDKESDISPVRNLRRAMIALEQALFDYAFIPETYAAFPHLIDGIKFNSCVSFPGDVDPPADTTVTYTTAIRANFADPHGINPTFAMNGDLTDHALRPTGTYLAPGSVVTITVPSSLVGKNYYVKVGSHDWDLTSKSSFKRLDRISKKFAIDSTTIKVFNPLGGAIGIMVPYLAAEGIVDVSVTNAVEAPFYSLKSFYESPDFDAELDKPAPWAVFETDNVMYTIPTHSIVPGEHDLRQAMLDWDVTLRAINSILGRDTITDKHLLYMISDVDIRGGAYSMGYPMSNHAISYKSVPGPTNFIDGPGPEYEVTYHEYGHSIRISKFPGEGEAAVNFLYVMGFNYGLNEDLDKAVKNSFGPSYGDLSWDLDNTVIHRLASNSFGAARDIANASTNEVRYQHRGYGHYFEIVNILGWCPLKNFWEGEFIDFENGTDQGINDQNIDSRIKRMSLAANTDLRPLFHVFGILPSSSSSVQTYMDQNNIAPSLNVYNRLQQYLDLIPKDNAEFLDHALLVYPRLNSDGPSSNEDYGVGWHYQKSLTYNDAEAQAITTTLQGIINQYYPDGEPATSANPNSCCHMVNINNNDVTVVGGTAPYTITIDSSGTDPIVTVVDDNGCESVTDYSVVGLSEHKIGNLKIYPNPASSKLYIDVTERNSKIASLQLISIEGKLIKRYPKANSVIDVSEINAGLYILQIVFDDGAVINKKVSVQK